ncbi:unnamed protein product [marine sediment metagenome]|uniref:Uncharacterized protein n=1 Tax=marine sediment metagenome TaxID=412755 RepID=X0W537_9ZZZZ
MSDKIIVTILEDGRIKTETKGTISSVNHQSADEFMAGVKELAGGPCETVTLKRGARVGMVKAHVHD